MNIWIWVDTVLEDTQKINGPMLCLCNLLTKHKTLQQQQKGEDNSDKYSKGKWWLTSPNEWKLVFALLSPIQPIQPITNNTQAYVTGSIIGFLGDKKITNNIQCDLVLLMLFFALSVIKTLTNLFLIPLNKFLHQVVAILNHKYSFTLKFSYLYH